MTSLTPVSYLASSISSDAVPEVKKISRITKACLPPIATFSHNLAELTSARKTIACGDPTDRSVGNANVRGPLSLLFCYWPGCEKSVEKVPFRSASQLKRHLLTHCTPKRVFCAECSLQFKNTENLKRHSLIHQGVKPYACEICHRTFGRTSGRSLCRKRHRLASRSQGPDQVGSNDGPSLSALELEVALDRVRPRPYTCSICGDGKSYTDPGSLRKHKRQYHSAPIELTSKEFQSMPDATKSPESVDPLAELTSARKTIACGDPTDRSVGNANVRGPLSLLFCYWPGCEKSVEKVPFRSASQLKRHLLTHCTPKRVFCAECSLQFKNTENLKRHSLIHQGVKPYACEICYRTFGRTSGRSLCRKRHRLASRNQGPDQVGSNDGPSLSALELEVALDRVRPRPYTCSICGDGKSYTDPGSLRKHKRQYHSAPIELTSKEFQSMPDATKSPESVDPPDPHCLPVAIAPTAVDPPTPIYNKPTAVQFDEDIALDLTEPQYCPSSLTDECAIDLSGDSTFGLSSAPDPIDLSSSHHTYPQVTYDANLSTEERLILQRTRSQQHPLNWDPEPGFSFTDLLTNMELDEVGAAFPDQVVLLHDLSPSCPSSKSHFLSPALDLRLIHSSFP
ncbi:unnamed protein product [Dicrocoelium dendriticum]|nr:unnamed protein product [Dicrocoelium dendriticum]